MVESVFVTGQEFESLYYFKLNRNKLKKPIAIVINDPHLKEENLEIIKSIFQQTTVIAKDLGLKIIDCSGDIMNSRKSQPQIVLTTFKDILDELQQSEIELHSCVGNHDKVNYFGVESFLDPFSNHPAFKLYRYGGYRELDGVNIHYASYFTDELFQGQIKHNKKANKWNLKNVLIGHIGVSGSVMNNGIVIESQTIIPSLFNEYDLIILGHYHDYQELAEGRIIYTGSCVQHNFGEHTGKGATILYDDLSTEIIPLKYPQYLKFEVNPTQITAKDIQDLKKEKTDTGDNLRIILKGTDSEVKSFNKMDLLNAGISVELKQDKIIKEEIESKLEAFDTKSLAEEFDAFCEKNKLDKKSGMKYFNLILNAAV